MTGADYLFGGCLMEAESLHGQGFSTGNAACSVQQEPKLISELMFTAPKTIPFADFPFAYSPTPFQHSC